MHRRQHHPVRRRLLAGGVGGADPGQHLRDRERRPDRPRHEGQAGAGASRRGAAGLRGRSEGIKGFGDLKGKRLSAAGGGVGSFNWRIGREALRKAGLNVDDAQFISQGTAGRLAGLVAGQIDAVALHPEDVYLAMKQKPGLTILTQVADLMPLYSFNSYGVATDTIAKDRAAVVDFVAAMVEANRAIYRDKDKVIPIMVAATQKPRDAVEYAWDSLTKNCIWSVNEGFDPERTQWTIDHDVAAGDIDAAKKPGVDQVIDQKIASDGVAAAGGRTDIHGCKL